MKHIKSYENNEVESTYYIYVDIERLEHFLKTLKEYNIKYTLYLLKSNQIGLFLIMKMTEKLKNRMKGIMNATYIGNDAGSVLNIKKFCEDVTDLAVSEIQEIFDVFEQSKKYNL